MRTITVKAIFKGLNNSCGYKKKTEYVLIISHKTKSNIRIENANGGGLCEYGSIVSFIENWDVICKL